MKVWVSSFMYTAGIVVIGDSADLHWWTGFGIWLTGLGVMCLLLPDTPDKKQAGK